MTLALEIVVLAARGVVLYVEDGSLKVRRHPAATLTGDDSARLRSLREPLVAVLAGAETDPAHWRFAHRERWSPFFWTEFAMRCGEPPIPWSRGARWVRFASEGPWHPLTDPPDAVFAVGESRLTSSTTVHAAHGGLF